MIYLFWKFKAWNVLKISGVFTIPIYIHTTAGAVAASCSTAGGLAASTGAAAVGSAAGATATGAGSGWAAGGYCAYSGSCCCYSISTALSW